GEGDRGVEVGLGGGGDDAGGRGRGEVGGAVVDLLVVDVHVNIPHPGARGGLALDGDVRLGGQERRGDDLGGDGGRAVAGGEHGVEDDQLDRHFGRVDARAAVLEAHAEPDRLRFARGHDTQLLPALLDEDAVQRKVPKLRDGLERFGRPRVGDAGDDVELLAG